MATYAIRLIMPGRTEEFLMPNDAYILDGAEAAGIDLPYSCRAGSCSACAAKLISGGVDQADGSFLDEQLMCEGWVLLCVAYPTMNCVIQTHMEEQLTN